MSGLNVVVGIKPKTIYRLEARKRDRFGEIVSRRISADIPNVFTDHGVEVLFGVGSPQTFGPQHMRYGVGTGSSPPLITDPFLDNFLAGASSVNGSDTISFVEEEGLPRRGYLEFRQDGLFPIGASGGNVNIAEVGAAFQNITSSLTPLCSRALVVDGSGNPTTFEWLEDEELLLTAFHRRYISLEDIVFNNVPVEGDGPDQTVTIRPGALGTSVRWNWPGDFGANTSGVIFYGEGFDLADPIANSYGSPTGAGSGSTNSSSPGVTDGTESYVPGSKQRTRWVEMATGSNRNIVAAGFGSSASGQTSRSRAFGQWTMKFDPGIPKSALHRFRCGITFKIDNTP